METKLSDNEFGSHVPETVDRESYLDALFENSLDAILMANDEQSFVEANPAACLLLGYTREELIKFTVGDLTPPSNLQFLPGIWRQFMSEGRLSGEYLLVCKNGSVVTTEFRAVANIVRGLHMAILHDISERKQAELVRSQLAAIVDSSDDAILSKTLDGTILTWNKGAERQYGYSAEEVIGKSVSMLIPPEQPGEMQRVLEHLKKGEVLERYETKRVKKNGERIDVSVTLSPVRDASGLIVGGSSIGQDITRRKRVEAERESLYQQVQAGEQQLRRLAGYLQTTQENERVYLAREVHDQLGQALTTLKMDLVWLTKRIPSEQSALKEKAASMGTLIDQAVATVRHIATELRPGLLDHLGLVAAIEWQVQEFAQRTSIGYDLELEEIKPALEDGLATQLFRIVQEALTNIARHAQATQLKIGLTSEAQTIVLFIEDNGVGIQPSGISDPKSLGLLGMRERALAQGGEFHIHGQTGKGTRLEVRIPRLA